MPSAYWPTCDGPLVAAYGLCGGPLWRYRREALSFGVPFMTSARLCAAHCRALPWWGEATRVDW